MTILSKALPTVKLLTDGQLWNSILKRHSHVPRFHMRHGKLSWKYFWDAAHFYAIIGLALWGSVFWGLHFVYGTCELREIPEGYEPRYWEYENYPVKQLIMRYINGSDIKRYEKKLAHLHQLQQRMLWRIQEERVQHLMYERADYKAWYYIPYNAKWRKFSADITERNVQNSGFFPSHVIMS